MVAATSIAKETANMVVLILTRFLPFNRMAVEMPYNERNNPNVTLFSLYLSSIWRSGIEALTIKNAFNKDGDERRLLETYGHGCTWSLKIWPRRCIKYSQC